MAAFQPDKLLLSADFRTQIDFGWSELLCPVSDLLSPLRYCPHVTSIATLARQSILA